MIQALGGEDMFRIGQLASIYRISGKTLRYYDELGLLRPKYVDEVTGYRYYTSSQIPVLNEIFLLKEMGLSLKEITYLMKEEVDKDHTLLKGVLELKQLEFDRQIQELNEKKQTIELLKKKLDKGGGIELSSFKVGIKKVEKMQVASLKASISTYSTQEALWAELLDYLNKCRAKIGNERYTIYYDSVYKSDEIQVEILKRVLAPFPETERIQYKRQEGYEEVAYLLHTGEHESVIDSYEAILTWIEENGYKVVGNIREEFHMDDFTTDDPKEFVTEIQIPVHKRGEEFVR
ncbi:MerR family transcriptional regulator [Extibacter sp. GGCC_0201]|nr:MerR family transcriptional regulator [Extibacter sp. GGCC_0201]